MERVKGNIIIPGTAQGDVLASIEPLSFWGGYDQHTGEIIDRRHPLSGENGADGYWLCPLPVDLPQPQLFCWNRFDEAFRPLASLQIARMCFLRLPPWLPTRCMNARFPW